MTSGSSTGRQDDDGLVRADRLVHDDAELVLDVTPTGYGPLRLDRVEPGGISDLNSAS